MVEKRKGIPRHVQSERNGSSLVSGTVSIVGCGGTRSAAISGKSGLSGDSSDSVIVVDKYVYCFVFRAL